MTTVIAWTTGTGNITLTYDGEGNGTIVVASDDNNLSVERSQVVTVTAGSLTRQITIRQAACPNFKTSDGKFFKLADGKYFNVKTT